MYHTVERHIPTACQLIRYVSGRFWLDFKFCFEFKSNSVFIFPFERTVKDEKYEKTQGGILLLFSCDSAIISLLNANTAPDLLALCRYNRDTFSLCDQCGGESVPNGNLELDALIFNFLFQRFHSVNEFDLSWVEQLLPLDIVNWMWTPALSNNKFT